MKRGRNIFIFIIISSCNDIIVVLFSHRFSLFIFSFLHQILVDVDKKGMWGLSQASPSMALNSLLSRAVWMKATARATRYDRDDDSICGMVAASSWAERSQASKMVRKQTQRTCINMRARQHSNRDG